MRKLSIVVSAVCMVGALFLSSGFATASSVDKFEVISLTAVAYDLSFDLAKAPPVPMDISVATPVKTLPSKHGASVLPRGVGSVPVSLGLTAGGGPRAPPERPLI